MTGSGDAAEVASGRLAAGCEIIALRQGCPHHLLQRHQPLRRRSANHPRPPPPPWPTSPATGSDTAALARQRLWTSRAAITSARLNLTGLSSHHLPREYPSHTNEDFLYPYLAKLRHCAKEGCAVDRRERVSLCESISVDVDTHLDLLVAASFASPPSVVKQRLSCQPLLPAIWVPLPPLSHVPSHLLCRLRC